MDAPQAPSLCQEVDGEGKIMFLKPEIFIEELRGAVARGWTYDENSHKEMDVDLAEAIVLEVQKLIVACKKSDWKDD